MGKKKKNKINCSGRVVTLAQVHQIREEEKRREAEKEEAAERRKERAEEAARKKAQNMQGGETSDVEDLTSYLDISGSEPPAPRRRPPTRSLCGIQGHTHVEHVLQRANEKIFKIEKMEKLFLAQKIKYSVVFYLS
jgi:hypothetical protein